MNWHTYTNMSSESCKASLFVKHNCIFRESNYLGGVSVLMSRNTFAVRSLVSYFCVLLDQKKQQLSQTKVEKKCWFQSLVKNTKCLYAWPKICLWSTKSSQSTKTKPWSIRTN